jgi:hypothetical protein
MFFRIIIITLTHAHQLVNILNFEVWLKTKEEIDYVSPSNEGRHIVKLAMYYIVKSMVYKEWIENRTLVSTIFSKI